MLYGADNFPRASGCRHSPRKSNSNSLGAASWKTTSSNFVRPYVGNIFREAQEETGVKFECKAGEEVIRAALMTYERSDDEPHLDHYLKVELDGVHSTFLSTVGTKFFEELKGVVVVEAKRLGCRVVVIELNALARSSLIEGYKRWGLEEIETRPVNRDMLTLMRATLVLDSD